ncbi:unnamed protein product [Rotaria sp. Silwood2]|nr:unnamed protein product [Rotaria sp. Silwood2]CAF4149949.1 unnamed protein product [Rotaria sp. Silwood2]
MFNALDCIDIDNVSPSLQVECNKILNDIQDELFFGKDLTYEHLMFLLSNRNTIETKFIEVLINRIHHLNIDENIRNRLITNVNKLSSNFIHIDIYSNVNEPYHFNYDSDEESYVEYTTDDSYSDENDSYDDAENQILDYIEMQQYLAVFRLIIIKKIKMNMQLIMIMIIVLINLAYLFYSLKKEL